MKASNTFLFGCILCILFCSSYANLRDRAFYEIQSLEDGNFLESNNQIVPKINDKDQVRTAPKRNGFTGQRWRLVSIDSKYSLLNQLNENNEVCKAAHGEEGFPGLARFTIIPVPNAGRDVFLIQAKKHFRSGFSRTGRLQNACLLNQGNQERVTFFGRCESHSTNQQWRFIPI